MARSDYERLSRGQLWTVIERLEAVLLERDARIYVGYAHHAARHPHGSTRSPRRQLEQLLDDAVRNAHAFETLAGLCAPCRQQGPDALSTLADLLRRPPHLDPATLPFPFPAQPFELGGRQTDTPRECDACLGGEQSNQGCLSPPVYQASAGSSSTRRAGLATQTVARIPDIPPSPQFLKQSSHTSDTLPAAAIPGGREGDRTCSVALASSRHGTQVQRRRGMRARPIDVHDAPPPMHFLAQQRRSASR